MADRNECEELRRALDDLHARLSPPRVAATLTSGAAPRDLDISNADHEPVADAETWAEIRNLEQALRDAGCD